MDQRDHADESRFLRQRLEALQQKLICAKRALTFYAEAGGDELLQDSGYKATCALDSIDEMDIDA